MAGRGDEFEGGRCERVEQTIDRFFRMNVRVFVSRTKKNKFEKRRKICKKFEFSVWFARAIRNVRKVWMVWGLLGGRDGRRPNSQFATKPKFWVKQKTHTCVVKFTAVVRGWEQRHQLSLREEFIAILDDLMGSAYQVKVVLLKEFMYNLEVGATHTNARLESTPNDSKRINYLRAECEANAAVVFTPSHRVFVRIRP